MKKQLLFLFWFFFFSFWQIKLAGSLQAEPLWLSVSQIITMGMQPTFILLKNYLFLLTMTSLFSNFPERSLCIVLSWSSHAGMEQDERFESLIRIPFNPNFLVRAGGWESKRQLCVLAVYFHLSERKDLVTEYCTMARINDPVYLRLVDELEMGTEIQK